MTFFERRTTLIFWFAIIIPVLLSGSFHRVAAQHIQAEVVFHTDKLPKEEREYLVGLDKELADLINSHTWVERGYSYDFPVRVELFFDKSSKSATYHRYGAGVLVATKTGVQLRDNRWDFRYTRDFRLKIGSSDDPLTNLLEFYIWICFGYELDKFSPLGGQPFYENARLISENSRFEINYIRGWDYRRDFVNDLTLEKYRNIRTASFHAAIGIYYANSNKPETARPHLAQAAKILMAGKPEQMELRRDDHILRYIDTKEFISALNIVQAFKVLDDLSKWDSKHSELYQH